MKPFEALTELDQENIVKYIEAYAVPGGQSMSASLEHVLRFWNNNKAELFKMFGEKLMLKRTFKVCEEEESIVSRINEFVASDEPGADFAKAYKELRRNTDLFPDNCWASVLNSYNLIDPEILYKNRVINELACFYPMIRL